MRNAGGAFVVPGGVGTRNHLEQGDPYIRWIADVHPGTQWTTSVCTGSLMLAEAVITAFAVGFLKKVRPELLAGPRMAAA